jgi:hypothetical protein
MTKSIPIDFFANVTPAVISAGGSGVNVTGLLLTTNTSIPLGAIAQFFAPSEVEAHFGSASPEYAFAKSYFLGYDGSTVKPAYLLVAQYPLAGVPAYLEGGKLATTLATLQAITSGTISITVNGALVTSSALNFSGATSYSGIAALVATGLGVSDASFTGSTAGDVLTVSSLTGIVAIGQTVLGASIPDATQVIAQLTGTTGEAGTYQLSASVGTITDEAMTAGALTVAYSSQLDAFTVTTGTPGTADSITVANAGTIANALKLSASRGAQVSAGAGGATPGAAMDAIVAQTQNWVTFTTLFEPIADDKVAFASWANGKLSRYVYDCWSTDILDATLGDDTGAFARIVAAGYDGTHMQYAPVNRQIAAAFVMGSAASIDFARTLGRRNFAFLQQSGLPADVADLTLATVLKSRGISFCGVFGSAAQTFFRYAIGAVTGKFLWMDSYINQVWLNDALKNALADLLANEGFIPYNATGSTKISQHLSDPIQAAVNFGAIQAGVPLSNAQIDEVNTLAGAKVDNIISQRGWALVIQPATAQVRAARGSPPIIFFYTDGQSVQSLALTSTEIQ